MRVVVVGAGMAGLSAALSARDAGADVCVVSSGKGASALATGAWDVAEDPSETLTRTFAQPRTVAERVESWRLTAPHHPYARMEGDPVLAVSVAHDRVMPALGIFHPFDLGSTGLLVATELGLTRRVATAQRALLPLDRVGRGIVAVAVLPGFAGCDGRFVAASLNEQANMAGDEHRFVALDVEFLGRRTDAVLQSHEVAALLDRSDTVARLSLSLRRALGGMQVDAVLLPPVLGLLDDTVADRLAADVGVKIGEMGAPLGGPQGARLDRRIGVALREAGCEVVASRVTRVRQVSAGMALDLSDGELLADAVVLASGKMVGGGLEHSAADGWSEPLFGLPLCGDGHEVGGRPHVELGDELGDDPFSPAPAHRRGVNYDARLRALDEEGQVVSDSLFVAGALLDGYAPNDGTGLGCCATTGFVAGRNAAGSNTGL